MTIDTRGEDNPLWEEDEKRSCEIEEMARLAYVGENLELVEAG